MNKPTVEGKRRYPGTGGYYKIDPDDNEETGYPCTCKTTCPTACKGQCGCQACAAAYGDFLSME